MRSALVGHTGFIGSNLAEAHHFDSTFNSSSIAQIRDERFDLVVCAAGGANSFTINHDPEPDRISLLALAEHLSQAHIEKLVLISTVCVYPAIDRPDEDTKIDVESLTPYGRNRYELENFLRQRVDTLVLRLPQLYGRNMRKGIVYDLLNDYRVEHIDPRGRFQYYGLARLWDDIRVGLRESLQTLNLATPPLTSKRVAEECFRMRLSEVSASRQEKPLSTRYTRSMTTRHSELWGRGDGHLMDEEQELESLRAFVSNRREEGH